jgi:hypothetical protein
LAYWERKLTKKEKKMGEAYQERKLAIPLYFVSLGKSRGGRNWKSGKKHRKSIYVERFR